MWFRNLLVAVLAFRQVASESGATARTFTEIDVVDVLRENPYVLPKNTRLVFQERLRQFSQFVNIDNLSNLRKRQSSTSAALLGSLANTISSLGKPLPKATVASIQDGPSPKFPEGRRKKIRYGPYRIPPISEQNVESRLLQQQGMTNTLKIGARKPCQKQCMILDINANLEYGDGTPVPNSPAGAWLHHAVIFNVGLNVKDATCGGIVEHLFEAGNERSDSPYYSPPSGIKSGYHVHNDDIFVINTELMNMEDKEKWAWVVFDFDYIEGFDPEWKEGKIVWMSIGPNRCTGSDLNPFGVTNLTRTQQPTKAKFTEYSIPWSAPADGLVLGANCHLHDGGTGTRFFLEQEMICESLPKYAKGMGGHSHMKQKRQMGVHMNSEIEHIEEQPACVFTKAVPIKKGQDMYIKADYDFTQHEGMKNKKGELDEVMGIAGALVAFEFPLK